ncbi:BRO family protein [Nodularia sphaerocarpa]|uniref:BRO family protein n=1 Tax=Nodularia sphaerocarpa TaxID=137816 RepID=UPI00232DA1B4|nr:BRO family protein [Nodularia sphaerocarpa]MDB9372346.1 BRO family protein [Nodularia sphaerocarpa CS-585]MDB9377962.1 BRO family protein [Nodularia sphaerocarpa CS-585A2]
MNLIAFSEGTNPFDEIKQVDGDGNEYWVARQLQPLLGYTQWRRFEETIERAKLACQNSGVNQQEHFIHLPGSATGKGRFGDNYQLTRYACYLTAMNGDPRKPEIAAAQTYFAVKTRMAETAFVQVNQELSATITATIEQALTPINQRLEQIEQRLDRLAPAKPKLPWTLPSHTPPEQVPFGYQQLEDGSWLSPEAYQSILRQSRRSLPWDIRRLGDFE